MENKRTIEEWRKERRLRKVDVYGAIGISAPTYDKLIKNPEKAKLWQVERLCQILNVSPDEIFFSVEC